MNEAEYGMAERRRLQVFLLGAFRVVVDGRAVAPEAWRSRRASALVKLLALAPRGRMPRERIADALWSDFDREAQLNNLNVAATRARAALASAGAADGTFLVRDGDALVLGPTDAVWVDAVAFEERAAAATADPAAYRAALALYGGELLPDDFYEEWAGERRAVLHGRFLALLARLGHMQEERGEFGDAFETYRRVLAAEPADEAAHRALMRVLARLGQPHQALAQFDHLTAALRRNLDAEPAPESRALAEAIRAGRLATDPAPDFRPTTALPAPLDDLIGCDRERAEVAVLIGRNRIVTLSGPGGIGKTRLALAVAHDVRSAFADGVVFVDLSAVDEAGLVLPAIAGALSPDGSSGPADLAGVAARLAGRRMLLVLDNVEQVIAAAPLVAALLERAQGCHVLATSRLPLRVRGEAEFAVPPLAVPGEDEPANPESLLRSPATALFLARARGARPDLDAGAHAQAIAAVCRRLDGLPLAIELAAARVRVLSPGSMLARLDRPLELLVDGARDLPERQQTMRRTVAWSYDLLSPAEQRLLRRLAVFAGGWTLEAAEAVAGGQPAPGIAVLDGLASLVEKNLVVRRDADDGESRFAMLETILEFALDRLAGTIDEASTRDGHAAYFVALAEESTPHLEGDAPDRWLSILDREGGNLRAALHCLIERGRAEPALRLVSALTLFWFMRGRLSEGYNACLAAAAMPDAASASSWRIDALNHAAFLAREAADFERAEAASAEALGEAKRLGDMKRQADALPNLGYVALQRGDCARARSFFEECLALNRALGNRQGIADALSFLGMVALEKGDLERAWHDNEESVAIWERLADRQAMIWARTRRGGLLLRMGRMAEARTAFLDNLHAASALRFPWGISWSLDGLAHVAAACGEPALARDLLETAAAVRQASGLQPPPLEQRDLAALRERVGADGGEPAPDTSQRLAARVEEVSRRAERLCVAQP